MIQVSQETLAALRDLAREFRVRDIGIAPEEREIYLLGGARSLNAVLGSWLRFQWELKNYGHRADDIWDTLDATIPGILDDRRVPCPMPPTYGTSPWADGSWAVIPIPVPGGPQHPWWSARTGRLMPPVRVEPYRVCSGQTISPGHVSGPALLLHGSGKLPPVFMSHGLDAENFRDVERCGGLLCPSFAITWKIPPRYGDIVFLQDARLPTAYLAPTGRRERDVLLTPTDSWSPTVGQIARFEKALTWELKGDRKWWSGQRSDDEGGWGQRGLQRYLLNGSKDKEDLIGGLAPVSVEDELKTMSAFWRRLRHLVRAHTERVGLYEYENREELISRPDPEQDYYAYMEIKFRSIMALDQIPVCLYPTRIRRRVMGFLDRMGFQGWRIPFPWNGPLAHEEGSTDEVRAAWAKAATAALLTWAENPCGSGLAIPPPVALPRMDVEDVRPHATRPYLAIAQWHDHNSMDWYRAGYVDYPAGWCEVPEAAGEIKSTLANPRSNMRLLSLRPSRMRGKKWAATFLNERTGRERTTHFGATGYEDYTMHGDPERKRRYLERHGRGHEDWNAPTTPGALSRWLLWNKPTLEESLEDFRHRFGV